MIDTLAGLLDWCGIVVFAMTGALAAARKHMDIFGFVLLGTATGIGGGTIRDTLLGMLPVFWVTDPAYLLACVGVSAAVFFIAHLPESRLSLLLRFDAVGMALFAVLGAEKTLAAGGGPVAAVAMGVVTATFGGVIRDVLAGEIPVILRREIYATAALVGALIFVLFAGAGFSRESGLAAGFLVAAGVRLGALQWNWSFPQYRQGR